MSKIPQSQYLMMTFLLSFYSSIFFILSSSIPNLNAVASVSTLRRHPSPTHQSTYFHVFHCPTGSRTMAFNTLLIDGLTLFIYRIDLPNHLLELILFFFFFSLLRFATFSEGSDGHGGR
ncbi:hypothetical protein LINPERHAP2_LOCUS41999 [Linum perenne]